MSYQQIALIIGIIWLFVVSLVLFRVFYIFRLLTKDVAKGSLLKVLEKVINKESNNKRSIKDLDSRISALEEKIQFDIQKVGLVRFNPFNELGGDHSFVLSLLDGKNNGVMITGLHTRERTRVYVKDIVKGKSTLELSEDEKKSLKDAQKS